MDICMYPPRFFLPLLFPARETSEDGKEFAEGGVTAVAVGVAVVVDVGVGAVGRGGKRFDCPEVNASCEARRNGHGFGGG